MHRHQLVVSGSNSTPPPLPVCAQYIGRMYSSASASKRAMPSRARASQVSRSTTGLSLKLTADRLTRAQCASRSGATPSNARAPSNTVEASQAACVRGPMIGTLPSCQSPSKKVQVWEKLTGFMVLAIVAIPAAAGPRTIPSLLSEIPKDLLAGCAGNRHGLTVDGPQFDTSFAQR